MERQLETNILEKENVWVCLAKGRTFLRTLRTFLKDISEFVKSEMWQRSLNEAVSPLTSKKSQGAGSERPLQYSDSLPHTEAGT